MSFHRLSEKHELVLEWLAQKQLYKKCSYTSDELEKELGINPDESEKILDDLAKIENNYGLVVENRTQGERPFLFYIQTGAKGVWLDYCKQKEETICPECGNPALEKVIVLRCSDCGAQSDATK